MKKLGNLVKVFIHKYFSNNGDKGIVSGSGFFLDFFTLVFVGMFNYLFFTAAGVVFWNTFWGWVLVYLLSKVVATAVVGFTPLVRFANNTTERFLQGAFRLSILPYAAVWLTAALFGDDAEHFQD